MAGSEDNVAVVRRIYEEALPDALEAAGVTERA
jgi:hypothetical protein